MAVKRFACTECGSRCKTKAKLNEHKKLHKSIENEDTEVTCKACKRNFSSSVLLTRHQRTCKSSAQNKDGSTKENDSAVAVLPSDADQNTDHSIKEMYNKMQTLLDPPKCSSNLNASEVISSTPPVNQTSSSCIVNKNFLKKNSFISVNGKANSLAAKKLTKNSPCKSATRTKSRLRSIQSNTGIRKTTASKLLPKLAPKKTTKVSQKCKGKNSGTKSASKKAICLRGSKRNVENCSENRTDLSKAPDKLESGRREKKSHILPKPPKQESSSIIVKNCGPQKKKHEKETLNALDDTKKDVSDESKDNILHNVKPEDDEVTSQEVSDVASGKKQFSCAQCSKSFSRKYHLDRHLKLSPCSGLPPLAFPCHLCDRVYSRKDNLREHLRQHTGEPQRVKKHKCSYCNKAFHGQSLLTIHIRTHTGEKPFECDFCNKRFPSAGALSKHRRTHTGERPFECKDCGQKFSLKGTLKRHIRVHTGVRPHKCEYCDKQFIQIGGLKAHMFYHTGENGFKCEICGKIFNRKARLQMHNLYVHVKHRPFVCEHCSKSFTRKEDLHRHNVLHTGEKPFKCPTCSKTFAIKPSLKLHLLTHTKEEPRSCHECGRAFIRKDCLLRHMRKRHRDLLDKILLDEKDEKYGDSNSATSRMLGEEDLCENITELLSLLVEECTLIGFGWPDKPVDEVLEAVIRRCGHTPVSPDQYSFMDRMRENAKLLFTVVIDDNAVKTLLNNQTVDEVILHVLRLAKT